MSGHRANIAVFVSGGGTNLPALIDAEKSGVITSGEIRLVIASRPDAYALTRAQNAGIDACAIGKADYPDTPDRQHEIETAIEDKLDEYGIDLIVLAGDSGRVGRLAFYGSPNEARAFFGKQSMEEIVRSDRKSVV